MPLKWLLPNNTKFREKAPLLQAMLIEYKHLKVDSTFEVLPGCLFEFLREVQNFSKHSAVPYVFSRLHIIHI